MDFAKEVVTNHQVTCFWGGGDWKGLPSPLALTARSFLTPQGYLTIGADLHFSKGLKEVIEKYRTAGDY